jgi:hypothetical protein
MSTPLGAWVLVNAKALGPQVVVTTPHTDANSIQKDNHQLNSKRQKGAPLSAPYSAYTKVGTFLLHKLVQRITPAHSCTHDTRIPAALIAAVG